MLDSRPFDGFVTLRQISSVRRHLLRGGVHSGVPVWDAAFSGQPIADLIDTARVE